MASLFKRVKFGLSRLRSSEEAKTLARIGKEALEKAESGLELKYLEGQEAENAVKLADAASKLINSLQGESAAVLRLGPLLLVKVSENGQSRIAVETVSTEIRRILDRNPALMNSPTKLFAVLQKQKNKENRPAELLD